MKQITVNQVKRMIEAICNPTAGNGRGRKIGRQVEAALRQRGVPCRLTMTKGPGDATTLARGFAAEGAETVLAIGGDGTAFEAAQGLLGTETALGVIPAGTGNDFVKTIGVPLEPMAALERALQSAPQKTDVGQLNGRLFLNEIGTGFDVMVLTYAERAKRFCRGLLPYLYGVLQTLFRFRAIELTYQIDGGETRTAPVFVLAAANGGVIGGGIRIAPEAKADDGLLDIVVVDRIPKRHLIRRLIQLMQGKILSFPETHYCRAKSIVFSAPGMRVNVDGEIKAISRAEAAVLPQALWIRR